MELVFQRTSVHSTHDVPRLEQGEDLNDALMDFFSKLGQALVPRRRKAGNGATGEQLPPVAYLGSLFFDFLRKGGVADGRAGHANVANWARKRLGKEGLFAEGVGAFAVPVNELLSDHRNLAESEKHWWLALMVNPRGGSQAKAGENVAVLCLDSFIRAVAIYDPPMRCERVGTPGYCLEIVGFSRVGFIAIVHFRAYGDGSVGPVPDPRGSKLILGGRVFSDPLTDLKVNQPGSDGSPGVIEGTIEFGLNSTVRTSGEYIFEYGGSCDFGAPLRFKVTRDRGPCHEQVVNFLGGYLAKESQAINGSSGLASVLDESRVREGLRLVDCPQQECAHDCGYFMLEILLRALQLPPEALRALGNATADELAALPWPSQSDVHRKKSRMKGVLKCLFAACQRTGKSDVEALFRDDVALLRRVRRAMRDGGMNFARGVHKWMAALNIDGADAIQIEEDSEDEEENGKVEQKKTKRQRSSSASSSSSGAKRRRNQSSSDSDGDGPLGRTTSRSQPVGPLRYTLMELEGLSSMTLRGLCAQRGLVPKGTAIVDRAQLIKALAAFAAPAKNSPIYALKAQQQAANMVAAAPSGLPAQTSAPTAPSVSKFLLSQPAAAPPPAKPKGPAAPTLAEILAAGSAKPTKAAAEKPAEPKRVSRFGFQPPNTKVEAAAAAIAAARGVRHTPSAVEEAAAQIAAGLAEKQLRQQAAAASPAPAPAAAPTPVKKVDPLPSFTRDDLDKLPVKTLRAYCAQSGRLPNVAVERNDFVQALLPLCSNTASRPPAAASPAAPKAAAPPSQPAAKAAMTPGLQPAASKSGDLPSKFTTKDLQAFPNKMLKNLCVKHGVLPNGPIEREDLVRALRPMATG